ncbi:hypothetical protein AV530_004946 [Patagioenas fasciata monilis]|uniref:Uncharacterized protein n=1 Tax=Patagioenas fasciata monilis TaxID=372326 RepID=A0A1V4K3D8_PATFA|nr:hypothetical protein AV530_004946 [Patagioenas fasciata monilis]
MARMLKDALSTPEGCDLVLEGDIPEKRNSHHRTAPSTPTESHVTHLPAGHGAGTKHNYSVPTPSCRSSESKPSTSLFSGI